MLTLRGTSFAAAAATVGATLIHPVPAAALAGAAVSLVGAIGLGVAFPHLGYFGPAIGHVPGRPGRVALTFDDGPHPDHTRGALDALDAAGGRATFFLVGDSVDRHADVAREISARGHEIGLHSRSHDDLLALRGRRAVDRDFAQAEEIFERVLGMRPTLYRPPAGVASPAIHAVARARGYTIVGWSVRGMDGVRTSPERVRARARRASDGDIVLLHDAIRRRDDVVPAGARALAGILDDLADRRLRTVTVTDLISG